jgi:hypothetical protein
MEKKLVHTFAALADLGQEVANTSDFSEMIRTSLHLLLGALAIRRGAIVEYREGSNTLGFLDMRGLAEAPPAELPIDGKEADGFKNLGLCALAIDDEISTSEPFFSHNRGMLAGMGVQLVVPLVIRGSFVGLVLVGAKASGDPFSADDKEVICAMARHIGVGLHTHRLLQQLENKATENRQLYEGVRAIYKDTVRAFAAAIDIKDKYTQGHSERVGRYSEIIAREMGWSEEKVEGIQIAGYLHDIGKLIVERDIINAPYKIDAQKSSELNRHPVAGYEILKPIHHPYADIPLLARHHHERVDGLGYPDGLKGDQIPIGARIVTLADAFDAMTTDRPYKSRRTLEDVLDDFRRNTGKQFDPEVVAAFCRALLKEVQGETKNRRIIKMLGKDYVDSQRIAPMLSELIVDLESGSLVARASNA